MKNKLLTIFLSLSLLLSVNYIFQLLSVRNAYLLGLAGAFTPCTIILIPIFLYRFGIWGDKKVLVKEIILTLLGFMITFSIIGLGFETISKSIIFDAFKIIMAMAMVVLAILQFVHRLNFDFLSRVTNPFLLGLLLPFALSFSSCVLPFFTVNLVSAATQGSSFVILNTVAFGIGLLLPALLVGVFGGYLYTMVKKVRNITRYIDYFGGLAILASAFYISTRIEMLHTVNILFIVGILFVALILLGYKIFRFRSNQTVGNYFMYSGVIIIFMMSMLRVWYLFNTFISSQKHLYSCSYDESICPKCTETAIIMATWAGIITIYYLVISGNIKLPKFQFVLTKR